MKAVGKSGSRLFVNYANRFVPMDMATRYVVQNGLIGRPVYGEVRLDELRDRDVYGDAAYRAAPAGGEPAGPLRVVLVGHGPVSGLVEEELVRVRLHHSQATAPSGTSSTQLKSR